MRAIIVAFCLFISTAAFAHTQNHERNASGILDPGLIHMMKSAHRRNHRARNRPKFLHHVGTMRRRYAMQMWGEPYFMTAIGAGVQSAVRSIEPHPAGCPRTQFCGCGVSERVFGHPVRDLYLARNWYRFPRGAAVPGNVIVRAHHVKYIESVTNGVLICYDPNSGGHLTRLQPCGSGGTIVRPG